MGILSAIPTAFEHGGIWMWPIATFQLLSIAIMVERTIYLFTRRQTDQLEFVTTYEDNIRRGEIDAVLTKALATRDAHPISRAVHAGAVAAQNFGGKDEIQGKMDEVLLHENAQLDKRVGYLSMLGNVATLTGLLGTIAGMIKSFAAVAQANPADKAALLSNGISEAMNCTAYGLIVAIPALIAYAVLQNRANVVAEDINQAGLKAFNWLSFSYDAVSLKASAGAGATAKNAGRSAKSQEANA
jgi:biopolymer transport protein ExbB